MPTIGEMISVTELFAESACWRRILKSYGDLQIASGSANWILLCFGHPFGKPEPVGYWHKPIVPVATATLGHHSGRTRPSGRSSATADAGWP